jgi:hypothetical protein
MRSNIDATSGMEMSLNLPRRSADIDAFMRYQSAQTEENKERWLKELQKKKLKVG